MSRSSIVWLHLAMLVLGLGFWLATAPLIAAQDGQGTVFIRYLGDAGKCRVNIAIRLEENDRLITMTGNSFPVEGLVLTDDYYTVVGNIQCPLWGTVCTASGEGGIELRDGVTYDIAWSNAGIGLCVVALTSMGE